MGWFTACHRSKDGPSIRAEFWHGSRYGEAMNTLIGDGVSPKPGPASGGLISDSNADGFVTDVIEASMTQPVIVDFWAPWCGPCKQLGPLLEKVVREARGAVRMVKINVDENQQLAAQLRVQSVPTVYGFKGGRPVDAFAGALPESQLRAFVQRLTVGSTAPVSIPDMIEQAKAAMTGGDLQGALDLFQDVLGEEPENPAALGGLARCLVLAGDVDNAQAVLSQCPPAAQDHADIAAARSAIELAHSAQAAGPLADLRAKAEANPKDPQLQFDLALALYAAGEAEDAIDVLLDLFASHRTWNEDAARKQLLQVFDALGLDHPLALSGRRRLSSLLFA